MVSTFGGKLPFADLAEVAGAYLFYPCRNHAFVDGNKRTAMTAAIVFPRLNGMEPAPDGEKWEQLVLDVAASRLDRDATTKRLRTLLLARGKSKVGRKVAGFRVSGKPITDHSSRNGVGRGSWIDPC